MLLTSDAEGDADCDANADADADVDADNNTITTPECGATTYRSIEAGGSIRVASSYTGRFPRQKKTTTSTRIRIFVSFSLSPNSSPHYGSEQLGSEWADEQTNEYTGLHE